MNSETQNSVSIIDEVIDEQQFNENQLIIDEKQQLNNSFNESLIKKSYCNSSQTKANNSENVEQMDVSFVANNNCNNDLVITNGDIDSIDHNNDDNGNQTDEDSTQSDSNTIEDKQQLIEFNINHIKYSIVENEQTITIYVYVKECKSLDVVFREDTIEVRFQTSDQSFHKNYGTDERTTCVWKVSLRGEIYPEECSHKLNPKTFEICLKKKSTRFRWDTLEHKTTPTSLTAQQMPNNSSNLNNSIVCGTQPMFSFNNLNVDKSDNWQPIIANEENNKRKFDLFDVTHNSNNSVGKELVAINNNILNKELSNRRIGYTGLDNLGNTCFMNSVIQCLSNTDPFRDYFSSGHFVQDINETNPLGTGGQIANAFAVLLKQLWLGKQSSVPPQRLKSLISEKVSQQFSGFAQHDAQELMAFLLDALHEDLNRIKQKPYIAVNSDECDNGNIADEQLADEAWKRYRMRNDSIVVDLFQGQFKSKLVCPVCGKISITFDPFLYLSVPFPKPPIVYDVYFFKRESNGMSASKPIKYKIKLAHDSIVHNLLDYISSETNIPTSALRLIQASNSGLISKFLQPKWTLNKPQLGQYLLLFELVAPNENLKEDIQEFVVIQRLSQPFKSDSCAKCDKNTGWDNVDLKACHNCQRVAYCNRECQSEHWIYHKKDCIYKPEPFGLPFVISLAKSQLTYRNLCAIIYSYARHSIEIPKNCETLFRSNVLNLNEFPIPPPFVLRTYRDSKASEVEEVIGPQLDPEVKDCFDQPLDIKNYYIAMDWINSKNYGNNWVEVEARTELNYETNAKSEAIAERSDVILLEDCLRLFTEPEVLNPQEAWFCPQCKENREAVKQIALWRLPQVLVIQLKRFSFRNIIWRDKIDRMVRYPVDGLDISDFYCRTEYDPEFRPIYDLYAVVNHFGGMFGGHYTAFAKSSNNFENLGWRSFDDSRVENMSEESVVTRNAYMLFYKLRE